MFLTTIRQRIKIILTSYFDVKGVNCAWNLTRHDTSDFVICKNNKTSDTSFKIHFLAKIFLKFNLIYKILVIFGTTIIFQFLKNI